MLTQGGAIFGTGLFLQGSYPGWMYLLLGCAKLLAISISVCAGMLSADSDVLHNSPQVRLERKRHSWPVWVPCAACQGNIACISSWLVQHLKPRQQMCTEKNNCFCD